MHTDILGAPTAFTSIGPPLSRLAQKKRWPGRRVNSRFCRDADTPFRYRRASCPVMSTAYPKSISPPATDPPCRRGFLEAKIGGCDHGTGQASFDEEAHSQG